MRCTGFPWRKPLAVGAVVLAASALMAIFPAPQGAVASPHDGAPEAVAEQILYAFCASGNCPDGAHPYAGLIMDGSGNLYGTTSSGGSNNNQGVVFELSPNGGAWTQTMLYRFCLQSGCADGAEPYGGLLMDTAGNLYGTTWIGGTANRGVVFELSPTSNGWAEKVLYSFCAKTACADGANSFGGLVMDGAGNLYGTTYYGGTNNSGTVGVVFELTPNQSRTIWTYTVLYSFCQKSGCSDGLQPQAGLIIDGAGNLYGTTLNGGNSGHGVAFELSPTITGWKETVLYSFCSLSGCADGAFPYAALMSDALGNLYGTTLNGGSPGPGVVFQLTPNQNRTIWTLTVLHSFCSQSNCADGLDPYAGVIMDGVGNIYGTTTAGGSTSGTGLGAVFQLTPNQNHTVWTETTLHAFCRAGCSDGYAPYDTLLLDASGNLLGTTYGGGNGGGTVFAISAGMNLTVGVSGQGTVTSSPAGINCRTTCVASFAPGTQVTLTEMPANAWKFAGWSGACSGPGGCTVTMNASESVAAAFSTNGSAAPYPSSAGAPQASGVPSPSPAAP